MGSHRSQLAYSLRTERSSIRNYVAAIHPTLLWSMKSGKLHSIVGSCVSHTINSTVPSIVIPTHSSIKAFSEGIRVWLHFLTQEHLQ